MISPNDIVKRIKNHNFEAYFVGGYVRDLLMKKESSDIDIATNAKYDQLKEIFKDQKLDETGKNFQVLMIDGVEVATYRHDKYENGIASGATSISSIHDDLARRDLTINSIAIDPKFITNQIDKNKLIDPFDGSSDIRKKIIRFTGEPIQRIKEDPVRMIRACRFLAIIERSRFALSTFDAISKYSYLINQVPKERIRVEIIKAMKAKNAGNFFRALNNTGLLKFIFPQMISTVNHPGGIHHNEDIFEHSVMTCDNILLNNPLLKIAAFLHDIGKPVAFLLNSNGSFRHHAKFGSEITKELLKDLKFSKNEIKYITSIIKIHMDNFDIGSNERSVRRLIVKLKSNNINYQDFISHIIADHNANLKKKPHNESIFDTLSLKFYKELNKRPKLNLVINGHDVQNVLNIDPGPKVGKVLKKLFDLVVDNPKLNKREILLKLIKEN